MATDLYFGVNTSVGIVDSVVLSTSPTGKDVEVHVVTANVPTRQSVFRGVQHIKERLPQAVWPFVAGSMIYAGVSAPVSQGDNYLTFGTAPTGNDLQASFVTANVTSAKGAIVNLEKIRDFIMLLPWPPLP